LLPAPEPGYLCDGDSDISGAVDVADFRAFVSNLLPSVPVVPVKWAGSDRSSPSLSDREGPFVHDLAIE
jgi:hypothetical protein